MNIKIPLLTKILQCGLLDRNIEISAVQSLADICFLHVLNLVFSLCFSMECSVVT